MRKFFVRLITSATFCASVTVALASTFVVDGTGNDLGLTSAEIAKLPVSKDGRFAVYGDILIPIGIGAKAEVPNRWPGGVIYYSFGAEISASRRSQFVEACNDWATGAPITCVERTNQKNYILVRNHNDGSGCGGFKTSCSPVGMIGGPQELWMYEGQWNSPRTLRHELGHALGKIHEHSRSDRGNHVDIHLENAEAGSEYNFSIVAAAGLYSDYDYDSIMHYSNCAFSKHLGCDGSTVNLQTIVPRHCDRDIINGGTTISTLDRDGLRNAYASGLQSLLARERNAECGLTEYSPDEIQSVSAIAPVQTFAAGWKKVEEKYSSTCGMASIGFGKQCTPPKKYITHWTDTDKSLNPSCLTKYEVWVQCGCPVTEVRNVCTRITIFKVNYDGLKAQEKSFSDAGQWRKTRVLYFQKIVDELNNDGLLAPDALSFISTFYQLNYLDPKFETKMLKMRAGMDSYARWKASVSPGYMLSLDMFRVIANNRKLRVD